MGADILSHYISACDEELQVPKPGNVHVYADGHGMHVRDFHISADVSAAPLCRKGAPLGVRIRAAVQATQEAVGQNTNLGIILLCAPLALAHERGTTPAEVITHSDLADAQEVFDAIRLARPGGLGSSSEHDVRVPARVHLSQAMRVAERRDSIARQWCNGFADVLGHGLTAYRNAATWPTLSTYMYFLATWPDSHVQRKHGALVAAAVQHEAERWRNALGACDAPTDALPDLLEWDSRLKADGINPGTSADLSVATAFAHRLNY